MSLANPWVLPSVLATALSLGLLLYVRVRRPPPPLWPSLPASLLGGLVFAVGDVLSSYVARGPVPEAAGLLLLSTGVLLLGSSAWVLALRVAEVQGAPFSWGRSPWAGAPLDAAQLEAELCTDPQPREGRLYRVSDEDAWLRVEGRPIRSARGRLLCWALELRDETALRRSEETVQHAQKLESLGVLAGGIAHDFNNLLLVMLGNAGLAREELPPASRAAGYLADVERAVERAADLTRQLLAFAGKGRLEVAELDASRLARELLERSEAPLG